MLDRRQVLLLAALVSARLVSPRTSAALQSDADDLRELARRIDSAALRAIGTKYLAQNPRENDRLILEQALALDDPQIEVALDRALRTDFREGRMFRIDEWFLSVTECRICALVSLLGP
jgi:hypothetical protein